MVSLPNKLFTYLASPPNKWDHHQNTKNHFLSNGFEVRFRTFELGLCKFQEFNKSSRMLAAKKHPPPFVDVKQ